MDYQIIATLGPACRSEAVLLEMLRVGVTGFRLNTSHALAEEIGLWREILHKALGRPLPVPLILDLQGSKWRLGRFPPFLLREGEQVEVVQAPETRAQGVLPVPHPDFFQAAQRSEGEIVLNDGRSALLMESAGPGGIRARVARGGEISPRKGITFARSDFRRETLDEKDLQVVRHARGWPEVRYALSYVKDAREMASFGRILGPVAYTIAKLERPSALQDARGISRSARELWLCRGDLEAEIGPVAMARSVRAFSRRVRTLQVPVLLAGQLLEHMTERACPTRSEICCLHDALEDGFAGVVLSDETAVGRHPLESCRTAALFRG
jgi:pyruvate kinase